MKIIEGRVRLAAIALTHEGGVWSHLWGSWRQGAPGPRLRAAGTSGSYLIADADGQEARLRSGASPASAGQRWGVEPTERWGRLLRGDTAEPVAPHHLVAADGAVQDALIEDAPELGRTRSAQNCLPGQTGGYLLLEVVQVAVGAGGQDRAGVVLGLQQAGDDERLVPAQDRGPGFDAGPLLEPAVPALPLALLQVIPQAGQRAAGVQLGYRVQAGGKSPAGGRSPVSILLITSCEMVALEARSCWDRPARVR